MQLSDVYLKLGESGFGKLIQSVSIGRLKTYQLYDAFKASAHLTKLNTESLQKHVPRFWARLGEHDEQFAKDLAQTVLVSHLDMIVAVLDFLGVPHEDKFRPKPRLGAVFFRNIGDGLWLVSQHGSSGGEGLRKWKERGENKISFRPT